MLIRFFEFAGVFLAKKLIGRFLNTKQELAVRTMFNEPRFMEFLTTRGSGKSTLFDILEAFADNEDPNYQTRAELKTQIVDLEKIIVALQADNTGSNEKITPTKKHPVVPDERISH